MKQVVQGDERKKPGRTLMASIRSQHQVTTSLETTQNQKEKEFKNQKVVI
jgi:hypothetical protein